MRKCLSIIMSIVAMSVSLSSCDNNDVFNGYVSLPQTGWGEDSLAVFRTEINDVSKPYDIYFQVRNQNNYKYANLWLFVDVISPEGGLIRDTTECILAHNDGSWIGGGWGSLHTLQCPYRLNALFKQPGNYTFRLSHGMRDDDIRGIHSIGLRITPSIQSDGQE